ncbi:M20/M25/M40 family metallo-hydrolase [Vulcanisaeta sp. JCM 14467]|uniref:M20/M25/M40 family metallo-hydrolase n=1 Tax=Vulcanisaeta sp. JCM 14467 TaxID=1295370 RepID=UPI000B135E0F|nr:M20/M25/M40 family metallo-hydrolase [Vulcanisaeta sp. JCM 14467]
MLILNGHMDVVPPGDESRWAYSPFSGKVVEGRIYGRGATDMKGGLAVIMMVFTELAPIIEKRGSGTLILSATADEETGGHPGVEALVRDGVLIGDAAIVAEPREAIGTTLVRRVSARLSLSQGVGLPTVAYQSSAITP